MGDISETKKMSCRAPKRKKRRKRSDVLTTARTMPQRLIESGSRQLFKGQVISEEFFLVFSFLHKEPR